MSEQIGEPWNTLVAQAYNRQIEYLLKDHTLDSYYRGTVDIPPLTRWQYARAKARDRWDGLRFRVAGVFYPGDLERDLMSE